MENLIYKLFSGLIFLLYVGEKLVCDKICLLISTPKTIKYTHMKKFGAKTSQLLVHIVVYTQMAPRTTSIQSSV